MKYDILTFYLTSFFISFGQLDSIGTTKLVIVQNTDSIHVDGTNNVNLKATPFKLVFHTHNTNAVYLNCSFDSTAYYQILDNEKDSLTCFTSTQTFSEDEKNYDHDITVVKYVDRGYHCLFAYAEDEQFVRFDSVQIFNPNNWIGVRTVESIYVLPGVGVTSLSTLPGKSIYLVFSPSLEQDGEALKITFE